MGKQYTLGYVRLDAGIKYDSIVSFRLDHVRNQHAEMVIQVLADHDQVNQLSADEKPTEIQVFAKDMNEDGTPKDEILLFNGVCTDYDSFEQDEFGVLTIHAKSNSYLMARKAKSRKFQLPGTLQDIADVIAKEYKGCQIKVSEKIDIKGIESQQLESDWEYLKRLASRENLVIYEDRTAKTPTLFLGKMGASVPSDATLFERSQVRNVSEYCHIVQNVDQEVKVYCFDETEYDTPDAGVMAGQAKGKNVVKESHISSDHMQLQNHVVLGNQADESVPFEDSPRKESIRVTYLSGIVKEVKGNQVRVLLDAKTNLENENEESKKAKDQPDDLVVDGKQDELVWMPYEALWSNWIYGMPDIGDKVYCYYEDGEKWICLGSFHEDTKDNKDYQDPSQKMLTTENMMVRFVDDQMELVANREGYEKNAIHSAIVMHKGEGITVHSTGNVVVEGAGNKATIQLTGEGNQAGIGLEAGTELVMQVGGSSIQVTSSRVDIKSLKFDWKGLKSSNKPGGRAKSLGKTKVFEMNAKNGKVKEEQIESVTAQIMSAQEQSQLSVDDVELLLGVEPTPKRVVRTAAAAAPSGNTAKTSESAGVAAGNQQKQSEGCGDPVNVVTGSLEVSHVDMVVQYTGGSFEIVRNYESAHQNANRCLGSRWLSVFDEFLTVGVNTVDVLLEGLRLERFHWGDGKYLSVRPGDASVTFEKIENGFQFTTNEDGTVREFDQEGRLCKRLDRRGNGFSILYDKGVIEKVVFTGGNVLTFQWEKEKISSITDAIGRRVQYFYEGALLTEMICQDGTSIHYTYTKEGYLHEITDQNGNTYVKNEYDRRGRVVRQMLSSGEEYVIFYDDMQKQNTFVSSATGEKITYTYDVRKLPLQHLYEDGTYTEKRYDKWENVIYERDRMGHEWNRSYNEKGLLLSETMPNGLCTEYQYDEAGNCIREWNNASSELIRTFDAHGNVLSEKRKMEEDLYVTYGFTYDRYGRTLTVTDPNGNTEYYEYGEMFAEAVYHKNYAGDEYTLTLDQAGRIVERQNQYGTVYYGYDYNDHVTYEEDEEGNVTRYAYDAVGNLKSVQYPESAKEEFNEPDYRVFYDSLDHPVQICDALGGVHSMKRDARGNVIEESGEVSGQIVQYEYNEHGKPTKIIQPDGGVEVRRYNLNDQLIAVISPEEYARAGEEGNAVTYDYDEMGRLIRITDPKGHVCLEKEYDLSGNITRYYAAQEGEFRYRYNLMGLRIETRRLLSQSETGEQKWSLLKNSYDKNGNPLTEERYLEEQSLDSENGKILCIRRGYDQENRLAEATDGIGAKVIYRYDQVGRLISQKKFHGDEEKLEVLYEYSKSSKISRVIEVGADGGRIRKTSYSYDGNGNVVQIKTPAGHTIKRKYDRLDRMIEEYYHGLDGMTENRTLFAYDPKGNVESITTIADGISKNTTFKRDEMGQMRTVVFPDGSVRGLRYDQNGRVAAYQNGKMAKTGKPDCAYHYQYDKTGKIEKILDPEGNVMRAFQYHESGKLAALLDGTGVGILYEYDLSGRKIKAKTTGGSTQTFGLTPWGQVNEIQDGNGQRTSFHLDAWGRITDVRLADGAEESYQYDPSGNMIASVDGLGNRIEYRYDGFGQLIERKDPFGKSDLFTYDEEGDQKSHTDRNGIQTTMKYNMYGSLMERRVEDFAKNLSVSESFGYTGDGLLKYGISNGMRYDYRYDLMNRLIEKSASGKSLLQYTYDEDGKMTSLLDITGKKTDYEYDLLGKLLTVSEDGKVLTRYEYDAAGRKKNIFTGNILHQSYAYHADGVLASISAKMKLPNGNVETLLQQEYQYDLNGNMIQKNTLQGQNQYTYDTLNRLTGVSTKQGTEQITERFSYDVAGNRLQHIMNHNTLEVIENYRYSAGNRLQSIERLTKDIDRMEQEIQEFTYDAQGNTLSDGSFAYEYDVWNRMTKATGISKTTECKIQTNRYDAEGLRTEMEENGTLVQFLYSAKEVVTETKEEGQRIRYIRGLGLIASDSEAAKIYYHTKDSAAGENDPEGKSYYVAEEKGSITHLIGAVDCVDREDRYTIGVQNRYAYDAFGKTTVCEETVENRFRYTGQQFDPVISQYYLRARFYHPVIARFLQEDTYERDGLNLFAYCQNNPLTYYDPSGHAKEPCEHKQAAMAYLMAHNGIHEEADAERLYDYLRNKKGLSEADGVSAEDFKNMVIEGKLDAAYCVIAFKNKNHKYDEKEYQRQLVGQEKGLHEMSIEQYQERRNNYKENSRDPVGNKEQDKAREKAKLKKAFELRKMNREKGITESNEVINQKVEAWMKTQAALHDPDQVAGGDPMHVTGLGDRKINSSIGSQWKTRENDGDPQSRVEKLDQYAASRKKEDEEGDMIVLLVQKYQ